MAGSTTDLLLGFAGERRDKPAWRSISGTPSRVYDGAIPTQDVIEFMSYPLVEGKLETTIYPFGEDGPAETFGMPERKAIVRADTGEVFGVFKNGYQIHQPREWLIHNLELLLDDGLQIGQARLIKGGAVALVQVELPDTREERGVAFRPYLTAYTSHDGSLSTGYLTGNIALSCENQMGIVTRDADKAGSLMRIRHSANSIGRIGEVRQRLGLVVEQAGDAFAEQVRELTDSYVSDARWAEFVKAFSQAEKAPEGRAKTIAEGKERVLHSLWRDDPRVAPWKNSEYGVLAAVNTAMNREFGAEKNREERNTMRAVRGIWDELDTNTMSLLALA